MPISILTKIEPAPVTSHPTKAKAKVKARREVNLRLIFVTFLVLCLATPAAWLLQRVQVNRNAGALVDQADACEKKQDLAGAASFLSRYIKLCPSDALVQVRLAGMVDKSSQDGRGKERAINLYYQAIGMAGPQDVTSTRRRLAELLLEIGKPASAEDEAAELLKAHPCDPHWWRLLALALIAQSHTGESPKALADRIADVARPMELKHPPTAVADLFTRAIRLDPKACDFDFTLILAQIYRQQPELLSTEEQKLSEKERQRLADMAIHSMVASDASAWRKQLAHYRYRMQYHLADVDKDLDRALALAPDALEVVLEAALRDCRAADAANTKPNPDEVKKCLAKACVLLEHAMSVAPQDDRAYLRLGKIYSAKKEMDKAVAIWQHGLEKSGKDNLQFYALIADSQIGEGKLNDAQKSIEAISQILEKNLLQIPAEQYSAVSRSLTLLKARWFAAKEWNTVISAKRTILAKQIESIYVGKNLWTPIFHETSPR